MTQWNGLINPADGNGLAHSADQRVGEAKLESHILDRVAGVVDMDFVKRVGVHGEIIRTIAWGLGWLKIGD